MVQERSTKTLPLVTALLILFGVVNLDLHDRVFVDVVLARQFLVSDSFLVGVKPIVVVPVLVAVVLAASPFSSASLIHFVPLDVNFARRPPSQIVVVV